MNNPTKKQKTKRCKHCNKKTLTGIVCQCGNYYCILHRHHDTHNCEYIGFKRNESREKLKESLVNASFVVKPKVEQI